MVNRKKSESESEGASPADEPCFRVRVCMRRVFGVRDVRARALVCVRPRRRVRWLARRLRRLFALPPRLCLRSRGHLLPPQEPLALLRPDDPVEVVPLDAECNEAATPGDVVDSVEDSMVTTVEELELERSPSPAHPDGLTETKRQALLMLEQFCAEPAAEGASESAQRPRRRRVRRRRRAPPAGSAATDADDEPAPAPVPGGGEALVPREPAVVPMVLRNDLQPRAPRVVYPLDDRVTPILLDVQPTEITMDLSY